MASQNINYNFTGNTANLSAAANQAINLLGQYNVAAAKTISGNTKAASGFKNLTKQIGEMAAPAKLATKALDVMKNTMSALIGIPLGKVFEQAMVESIEYVENLNLFTVAMGESIDEGREFVNTVQEMYGLDPSNIMRYTGIFYQLASAIEVADGTASTMSLGLTKMGVDISSLFNIPIDKVMENLSSGMQGMTRAVRKYGMDIRVSTLQTEAASLGIAGSILTMSEANRQGLRYITMLRQMSNATGDFAKTIESPANQLRIVREQLMQLGRAIGDVFIGTFSRILPYINGVIMALRTVISLFAMFLGFKPMDFGGATDAAEGLEGGLGGVADAAGAAAKAVKKLTAPFDELNVIQEESSGAGGGGVDFADGLMDPKLEALIAQYEAKFEGIKMKANQVRDAILEFLGIDLVFDENGAISGFTFDLDTLVENIKNATGIDITPLLTSLGNLWDRLAAFGDTVVMDKLRWLYDNVLLPIGSWVVADFLPVFFTLLGSALNVLQTAIEALTPLFEWLWDNVLVPIAQWTGGKIIEILQGITEELDVWADWISSNQGTFEAGTVMVGLFFAAWKISNMERFSGIIGPLSGKLVALATSMWGVVTAQVASAVQTGILLGLYAWDFVKSVAGTITQLGLQAGAFLASKVELMLLNAQVIIGAAKNWLIIASMWAYVTVLNLATTASTLFSGALAFLAANPIVLIIGAIALLIAAIVLLAQNWDWVKETAIKAWDGIKKALEPIANWFKSTVINPIIRQFNGFLSIIETVINSIVKGLNKISVKIPDWVPIFGGKTFKINMSTVSLPRVPELATGGVVTGPTMAMIGEGKYHEAIIPLGNSPQMAELINKIVAATSAGRGEEITVNITAELDGDVIYKNQKKVAASRGIDFGMGAFVR